MIKSVLPISAVYIPASLNVFDYRDYFYITSKIVYENGGSKYEAKEVKTPYRDEFNLFVKKEVRDNYSHNFLIDIEQLKLDIEIDNNDYNIKVIK